MSTRMTIICDECGAQKGEGNGWLKAWLSIGDVLGIVTHDNAWEDVKASGLPIDLCGHECAHKILDRWLETGSIANSTTSPEHQTLSTGSLKPDTGDTNGNC